MLKYLALAVVFLASVAAPSQEPVRQPILRPIVNRPFTVRPAQFIYYTFTVPAGSTNAAVLGRFEASGGAGNDVEVYILDEDGFVNWQNGHAVSTYYNSGRLTQANVRAYLPPREATYYLVFSNRFSVLANKAVIADMSLAYE